MSKPPLSLALNNARCSSGSQSRRLGGAGLEIVRELLGHQIIQMTLRYSHLAGDHKRASLDQKVSWRAAQAQIQAQKGTQRAPDVAVSS